MSQWESKPFRPPSSILFDYKFNSTSGVELGDLHLPHCCGRYLLLQKAIVQTKHCFQNSQFVQGGKHYAGNRLPFNIISNSRHHLISISIWPSVRSCLSQSLRQEVTIVMCPNLIHGTILYIYCIRIPILHYL